MAATNAPSVVLDTNVVFEGLTNQGGACGLLIDAWLARLIIVHVSDALAYEYVTVMSHKPSATRWARVRPALATLLARSVFTPIHYTWRPSSPDPGDNMVVDCTMNVGAVLVTNNVRDFRQAQRNLGLRVMTPLEMVEFLAKEEDD